MLDAFGERQQALMRLLMKRKEGLTIDGLADELRITRTAVRQHLTALERTSLVERGESLPTGGRPVQVYRLTQKGVDAFPKQYSWFSEAILRAIRTEKGSGGLKKFMEKLGLTVSEGLAERLDGKDAEARVAETVKIMNELGYDAEASGSGGKGPPPIEARNCVYHALAARYPEVCQFDLALLGRLTDSKVIHETCIVRGGGVCRFRFARHPPRRKA
jgi:predicted ArsR family transcriptional regulator